MKPYTGMSAVCAACRMSSASTTASGCDAGYVRPSSISSVLLMCDIFNGNGEMWCESIRLRLAALDPYSGNGCSFTKVDRVQLNSTWSGPDLQFMLGYQAVLIVVEQYHPGLGNRTVEYWEAGGAVVTSVSSICSGGLGERFNAEGLEPLDPASISCIWHLGIFDLDSDLPADVREESSPLMTGVRRSLYNAEPDFPYMYQIGGWMAAGNLVNGWKEAARWGEFDVSPNYELLPIDYHPLLVSAVKGGRSLAAPLFFPVSATQREDLLQPPSTVSLLLQNAIHYSLCAQTCESCAAGTFYNSTIQEGDLNTCAVCWPGTYQTGHAAYRQVLRMPVAYACCVSPRLKQGGGAL